MPEFVREKAWRVLNHVGVAPSRSNILVMGVAYKKNIDDWRESPSINVIKRLLEDHAHIVYHDPFVPELKIRGQIFQSIPLTDEAIANADIVIILTDHSQIDYVNLVAKAKAILDTRGVTRHLQCDRSNVTLL
jgi:UDP-N-acetyl-D-glucosamine dehydrogenase